MSGSFNIRVYGLCIHEGRVLLSDEVFRGIQMTKFPGGGLEYGEGTVACLHREFEEEQIGRIKTCWHYYTTDFFQPALFFEQTQLLSIYYWVDVAPLKDFPINNSANFSSDFNGQHLRWAELKDLKTGDLTFPIDQKVLKLLQADPDILV